jgi:hypothetical protein
MATWLILVGILLPIAPLLQLVDSRRPEPRRAPALAATERARPSRR